MSSIFALSSNDVNPFLTVALEQIFCISENVEEAPPPPCVQKGIMVLPEKSWLDKNVLTGLENVYHQTGEPIKIVS